MKIDRAKKTVEPFNLFGEGSLIYTKQEAKKVLKDNSYYFFVASAMSFGFFLFQIYRSELLDITNPVATIVYLILGFAIRKLKSRVASSILFISFLFTYLYYLIENGMDGYSFIILIFFAASYRCLKASFFYHKNGHTT